MIALALDLGEARVGIAVSDATGTLAMPVKVLPAQEVLGNARSFRYIIEDYEPDVPQAQRVIEAAKKIARATGLPLEFIDERLSSREAKRILREQGLSEREMRGKVDSVAASLFLQTWLDVRNK